MNIKNSEFIQVLCAKYLSPATLFMSFLIFIAGESALAQSSPDCRLPLFGIITVDPDIEVNGSGQNIDTIEFWKAPDSSETLMFVTAKGNHMVEVWKYPFEGNEQPPLTHSTFNNSQVNGLAVDQETDLLYVAIGEPSSTVSVFSLPDLTFQMNFNEPGENYLSEPNLALLNLTNGNKNIYVSADFTVDIHNAVTGEFIDEFTPERGLETMAADSFYQRLYIPDENNRTGVYVYNPDGTIYTNNGSHIFGEDVFDSDAEGIIVYSCPLSNPVDEGKGFIAVSDQRSAQTDFEFFDRETWEHLGTLHITGVSNTDGIASYPYPLPDYPLGVFAVLNDDHAVAIVGWDKIFDEIFPIPVELTSFTAKVVEYDVQLDWITATETNNHGFDIERSEFDVQSLEWTKIGFVAGHGTTSEQQVYSFLEESVPSGKYQYRLKQIDLDGSFEYSNMVEVEVGLPIEFALEQNYPNPFNPSTILRFSIPQLQNPLPGGDEKGGSLQVQLIVFDMLGNKIATIVNEEKPAGVYEIEFKVKSLNVASLTSGIYFYRLRAGNFVETKKMVYLK